MSARQLMSHWNVRELGWPEDVLATVGALAGPDELAWLDTSSARITRDHPSYSLICARPVAVLEQPDRQPARVFVQGAPRDRDVNGWQLWRRAVEALPKLSPLDLGLTPGWIGYVGFEMARQLERLPASHPQDLGLPLLRMALYDRGFVLDHRRRRTLAIHAPGIGQALGLAETGSLADWTDRWNPRAARPAAPVRHAETLICHEIDQAAYEHAVRRALEYIAAGDIYQVNLAHRLRLRSIADPLSVYARLRRHNPSPYAALLRWADGAIASVSPELFVQLRGREVRTRPIKGTRPRRHDPVLDEIACQELWTSPKEAAELAMIVDLHRNDLGRVCAFGSVRVPHPRRLEAHPTVFHTVADVVGVLPCGRGALDLLGACFPAGSVTGVPKIRAMQIIDELEPVARGAYTGAIGVLGLDGQMTFNVAIRTLQIRGTAATLYVGGGIVADSDPRAEYEETLAKARGIVEALEPRGVASRPRCDPR